MTELGAGHHLQRVFAPCPHGVTVDCFPAGRAQPAADRTSEPAGARWQPGAGVRHWGWGWWRPVAAGPRGLPALGAGAGGAAGERRGSPMDSRTCARPLGLAQPRFLARVPLPR